MKPRFELDDAFTGLTSLSVIRQTLPEMGLHQVLVTIIVEYASHPHPIYRMQATNLKSTPWISRRGWPLFERNGECLEMVFGSSLGELVGQTRICSLSESCVRCEADQKLVSLYNPVTQEIRNVYRPIPLRWIFEAGRMLPVMLDRNMDLSCCSWNGNTIVEILYSPGTFETYIQQGGDRIPYGFSSNFLHAPPL